MVVPVTEFVIFKLKSSVKPEDHSNEEGASLCKIFSATKQQSGHQSSAWGRTVEDENVVVWAVVWEDSHAKCQADLLTPYLEPDSKVLSFYTTLTPSPSETETFTTNPVTELATMTFPSSLNPEEHKKLNSDLINLRVALTEKLDEKSRANSWAMAQVHRPGTFQHPKSPSGEAFVYLLAVGWESVDAHMAARETKEFEESIKPIREKMLPAVEGLGMKHVSFKKI
ncbi:hypothetical protein ALT_4392 [Aspergillus lentulus]|uniref:ABM domain-containing protein n=1 Tax=Aspergillus lentulus TaxID=293939 RepID=A0AAN4TAL8_ASPLE|nr:uncharacterized protein IFM58399_05521 [Aspergillus lentulus]KAF4155683.1 hypothetical protein CNMCM6069_007765 [Aspergillus lentulus]KAF4166345.1 hypothetical protein CNMCM6936_006655 [Aspergillus lentulus]KAF4175411.1 hypothetical protein CNMCM8060_007346 [Aspergillus lentulus]KAF4184577.1 hypothetical protein CNMCM7927_007736 [Aspergillus lentulus]KAF4194795.1 hypothetical protein CNMCM8694_007156 [Aspergillus lentulus]